MKQAAITGVKQAQAKSFADLQADAQRVLVKVTVAPLCTEYKAFANGQGGRIPGS